MITEDYVSFETAKLLKEKGFDDVCHAFYDKDGIFINLLQFIGNSNLKGVNDEKITFAPTLQMAMKWLRKEHFLFIDIDPLTGYKWSWSIWLMNDPTQKMGESLQIISNYNEACEAAIKYCLENLI